MEDGRSRTAGGEQEERQGRGNEEQVREGRMDRKGRGRESNTRVKENRNNGEVRVDEGLT